MGFPGFLADALPDYLGQQVISHHFENAGLAQPNALDMLAWLGSRAVGALEFEPSVGFVADQPQIQSLPACAEKRV